MKKKPEKSTKSVSSSPRRGSAKSEDKGKTREAGTEESQQKTDPGGDQKTKKEKSGAFKEFAGTTSRLVQQAASILEEEIAAGIVAAKKVEEQFIRVNEIRSGKPDELMQRFRRDAHEVVDILLDLLTSATKYFGGLTQRVITIRGVGRKQTEEHTAPGQLPTLMIPKSIKAGESAEVTMTLENASNQETDVFSFHSTDLVNAAGDRIDAKQVAFAPSSITIGPRKKDKVVVTVRIPKRTVSGVYSGLIQATKLDQLRAVLIAEVD